MKQWPVVEKQLNSFTDINWSATLFTGHEQIIARKGFPWKMGGRTKSKMRTSKMKKNSKVTPCANTFQ